MSAVPFEQAVTLIERYKEAYRRRYKSEPTFNVVSARYDIAAIIREITYPETAKLFSYFFRTQGSHDLSRFIYGYHDLYRMMKLQEDDREYRKKLRTKKLG